MNDKIMRKLTVLADAAKYDVSCATSGVNRSNKGSIGNATAAGICHTWSSDGRCVSLLKILMTNYCVYDCEYCVNRLSNDVQRASFTPEEIAELTLEFYRRNYIEGLFLSSAIEKNPNHTMEKIAKTLMLIRNKYSFSGYIHVKAIPGADPLLIQQAGNLADRMSVNIELPTERSLKLLAPQKPVKHLFLPMKQIKDNIQQTLIDKRSFKNVPKFVPAGQSTQMIVGATGDTDLDILDTTSKLYKNYELKRVYFSAYVPVNKGINLPDTNIARPMIREHRLYQADWLLRFYKFNSNELLTKENPNFDLDFDPKMVWALRNPTYFPIEINSATYEQLLRIPGVGVKSAIKIINQRRVANINYSDLKKMGIALKRAKYFITCKGHYNGLKEINPEWIKKDLMPKEPYEQLRLNI